MSMLQIATMTIVMNFRLNNNRNPTNDLLLAFWNGLLEAIPFFIPLRLI